MNNTPFEPELTDIPFEEFNAEHGNSGTTNGHIPSRFVFRTAAQLTTSTSAEPAWIVKPWLAAGSVTELSGKIKSAGKTTFTLSLCRSLVEGRSFLGEAVAPSKVVYLTEQPDASLRVAIERAGLRDSTDFHFLSFHLLGGAKWPDVVQGAIEQALEIKAKLIVIDTLGQFAALRGSSENDAGAALEAMSPLQTAAARCGLAVLVIRHERKGLSVEVGESSRGSSAFAGAVDVVLSLRRDDSRNSRPNQRLIQGLSRFDETPASLLVELVNGEYQSLGDSETHAKDVAEKAILANLPGSDSEGYTLDEICKLTESKKTVIHEALSKLLEAGQVSRTGKGKRGSPYLYARVSAAE